MPKLAHQLEIDQCPHCGVNSPNLNTAQTLETDSRVTGAKRYWHIFVCQRCGGVVTATADAVNGEITEIHPTISEIDESIPHPAKDYLSQASGSIHAPAGAIMLAASAVDAMLKKKGYKEGSLYTRIDQAVQENLITEDMAKWAHDIRLDANDQRHADEGAALPTEPDARKCVDFALAFAQFLFVLPARVQRGLAKAASEPPAA
jgi:hypothetical protein